MLSILLRIFGDAQHSCSANGTHIAGLISEVPAKISSELPRHGRLGSPWNIPTDIGCVLGGRSGCQNFRASFQGFSKTSKRRTEAYRMHVGTDFLKGPPVTGQYWSLFQCSVLGTGGTCDDGLPFTILRDVVQQRTSFLPHEEQRTGLLPVGSRRRTRLHTRAGPVEDPLHGVDVLLGEIHEACLDERHLEPAYGHATMEDA